MKLCLRRTASVCNADSGEVKESKWAKSRNTPDSTHQSPIKRLVYHRRLRISLRSKRLLPPPSFFLLTAVWSNCFRIIILFLRSSTPGRARRTPWSTLDWLWLFSGGTASLDSSLPLLTLGLSEQAVVHCFSAGWKYLRWSAPHRPVFSSGPSILSKATRSQPA